MDDPLPAGFADRYDTPEKIVRGLFALFECQWTPRLDPIPLWALQMALWQWIGSEERLPSLEEFHDLAMGHLKRRSEN
jgi:hypothetical protein